MLSPSSNTRAPKLLVRSTLLKGVPWGMTMVAGMEKRWA
jgi:hypothetical protein